MWSGATLTCALYSLWLSDFNLLAFYSPKNGATMQQQSSYPSRDYRTMYTVIGVFI